MGGHGGLNILPQKRWNVYNFDNREKVRRDEEAAAREDQLKREQAAKRDAEFRLERLRAARGLAPLKRATEEKEKGKEDAAEEPVESEPKTGHINLFEGIKIFDPVELPKKDGQIERERKKTKKEEAELPKQDRQLERERKKMKKEEAAPRVVTAEDEKYRLGYGVAGKGVKLPWYLERRSNDANGEVEDDYGSTRGSKEEGKIKSGKKTLQELREERLKREKKERQRAVIMEKSRRDGGFSRR